MKAGGAFLLLIATVLSPVSATEPGELGSGIASLGNGVSVHIVTKAEPPERAPTLKFGNGYQVGAGILHRSVTDAVNHTYFGYDLHVEPTVDTGHCRVAIMPLSRAAVLFEPDRQSPASSGSAGVGAGNAALVKSSFRPVFLPNYPGPQVVGDGDTIALDLLTTGDGRQKVVDYIEVSCKTRGSSAPPASSDASLDDLQLTLTEPTVYLNRTVVSGPAKNAHLTGSLLWFYLRGKGRFILSLLPRQDFVRVGTVHDNIIAFTSGNSSYEIRNAATVFGSGRLCNLYVLSEPSFETKVSPSFGTLTQRDGGKK